MKCTHRDKQGNICGALNHAPGAAGCDRYKYTVKDWQDLRVVMGTVAPNFVAGHQCLWYRSPLPWQKALIKGDPLAVKDHACLVYYHHPFVQFFGFVGMPVPPACPCCDNTKGVESKGPAATLRSIHSTTLLLVAKLATCTSWCPTICTQTAQSPRTEETQAPLLSAAVMLASCSSCHLGRRQCSHLCADRKVGSAVASLVLVLHSSLMLALMSASDGDGPLSPVGLTTNQRHSLEHSGNRSLGRGWQHG